MNWKWETPAYRTTFLRPVTESREPVRTQIGGPAAISDTLVSMHMQADPFINLNPTYLHRLTAPIYLTYLLTYHRSRALGYGGFITDSLATSL